METIKHAAVKWVDGKITTGRDHSVAFQKREGWRDEEKPECGFITSEGNFVNREVAAKIAVVAGQISEKTDELHSEDLWFWPKDPYSYDDEKGYYK